MWEKDAQPACPQGPPGTGTVVSVLPRSPDEEKEAQERLSRSLLVG